MTLRNKFVALAGAVFGLLGLGAGNADAQVFVGGSRVVGGGFGATTVMPGRYFGVPGGTQFNPVTRSLYQPWAGQVHKPSGTYNYIPGTGAYTPFGRIPGTGIYQNPFTGNTYNPGSGVYRSNFGWGRGWGW